MKTHQIAALLALHQALTSLKPRELRDKVRLEIPPILPHIQGDEVLRIYKILDAAIDLEEEVDRFLAELRVKAAAGEPCRRDG